MNKIKKEYKMESFVLNFESIDKIEIMSNRRQIKDLQVGKIHSVLMKGENPIGTLIINNKNGVYRLIDGNHRIEALKRFYGYKKENKKVSIECDLKIYKDLTDEEEIQVYTNEAKRQNESHEDRLSLNKENIIFWKLTQDRLKEFPCPVSIYPQKKSLRFRTILDSLCTVKSEMKNGYTPRYLGKEELVNFAKSLEYNDFLLIKKFVNIFQKTFGDIDKDNTLVRRQGFIPLFDIFVKNFQIYPEDKVIRRFSLIIGKSDLIMYLNMQGREAQQKIREIMVGYINKGQSYSKNAII